MIDGKYRDRHGRFGRQNRHSGAFREKKKPGHYSGLFNNTKNVSLRLHRLNENNIPCPAFLACHQLWLHGPNDENSAFRLRTMAMAG
jgi:hypothetical protein